MSEYKVEKSLSADRLLVQDDKLTSDIWKTTKKKTGLITYHWGTQS